MNIRHFLLTALFSFADMSLNATVNVDSNNAESTEITYCISEDQKIDVKDWVQFPITIAVNQDKVETVQISFPSQPEFINSPLSGEPLIVAEDSEGMTYSIARMIISSEHFNIEDSVDFITEAIKRSYKNKLIWKGKTQHSPDNSPDWIGYILAWVNNGNHFTTLMIVKSQHVVYFLETSVTDEIYQDIETAYSGERDNQVFEKVMHDSLKTGVFINSFRVTSEMKTGGTNEFH